MRTVRATILVSGLVQGVFFRATTVETAHRIGGLTGFAKNLPDGRVEVVAEGAPEKVDRLVEWLHHGPPSARVTGVVIDRSEATGEFAGFAIER
ncbi:MAG: acylphosphatase [Nitrospinae bacterium]|nr:acylphosphatase [Nitrospinota bacterium]